MFLRALNGSRAVSFFLLDLEALLVLQMKKMSIRDREATCLKLAVCQATVPCPSGLPTWEEKPGNPSLSSSSVPDNLVTSDKSLSRAEPVGWTEQFLPMLMARRLDFCLHRGC